MKLKNVSDLLLSIVDKNPDLANSELDVDYFEIGDAFYAIKCADGRVLLCGDDSYKSKHDVILGEYNDK